MTNIIKFIKEKTWEFIDKNLTTIFFIIITIASLQIRFECIEFETNDYTSCLSPWYNELKENGGLKALELNIGNYNIPYITILALLTYLPIPEIYSIKLVSILFDYILAISVMVLVSKLGKNNKNIKLLAYSLVLFTPTVILNSATWAQCDAIYATFAIISLIYLIDEKYIKSFIFLGISFAFKLQFIFLLPLYIFVYVKKRNFSLLNFAIIPIVNFIMCLPAILAGRDIKDCLMIYFNQAQTYDSYISLNFPGIYNLFLEGQNLVFTPNEFVGNFGILFTLFIFILATFILLSSSTKLTKEDIISLGLWSVLTATFFLPQMHDRYMFLADILSIVYFIIYKEKWYIPLGIILCSLYCYSSYLFGNISIPIAYVSILNLGILCILTRDILQKLQKNNLTR